MSEPVFSSSTDPNEEAESKTLEEIAEAYLSQLRAGIASDVEVWAKRYPNLATEIRNTLPAMAAMEEFGLELDGSCNAALRWTAPEIEQVGDYRILGELGRGGMGIVYEAEQQSLRRRVALKVLPRMASDEIGLARFQREARAAAKLHHSNIVPVFQVGQDGDHAYYAMQLIEGQGLDAIIKDLRHLPADHSEIRQVSATTSNLQSDTASGSIQTDRSDVLRGLADASTPNPNLTRFYRSVAQIGLQASDALAYAHDRGVVHRDVKPSNLLLDSTGVVWVSDFGLAMTDEGQLTRTQDILGTLRYMSPERFQHRCDARADIYALGITLYELLVKEPAFQMVDRLHLIKSIMSDDPPAPRHYDHNVPLDLETIILKATEKEPRDRYQSAATMAEDLRCFLNDDPIQARRIKPIEKLLRWRRRNKNLATALTVIASLLIALIMLLGWTTIRQNDLRQLAEDRGETLLENLYFSQMSVAGQANSNGGNIEVIRELTDHWLVDEASRKLRGWEWYYLRSVCESNQQVFKMPYPLGSDWSSDDQFLAVAQGDGSVLVVDSDTGETLLTYSPDEDANRATDVAWHPTKSLVATAYQNGRIRLWNPENGNTVTTLDKELGRATDIYWSPDGKWLTWGSRHGAWVWNPFDEPAPFQLKTDINLVNSLQWSPDSRCLFVGNEWMNKGSIWDILTREKLREVDGRFVIWTQGGHEITHWLTTERTGNINVWDASTEVVSVRLVGHRSQIRSIDYGDENGCLVTGSQDNTIRVWDFLSGELEKVLHGHTRELRFVSLSNGQHRIASTGGDDTLRFWNLTDNVSVAGREKFGWSRTVCWHPSSKFLYSANPDTYGLLWNVANYEIIDRLNGITKKHHTAAWNSDGSRLVTCGVYGIVEIWDTSCLNELSAARLDSISTADILPLDSWDLETQILDVSWSPDGKRLAITDVDGKLRIWKIADGHHEPDFETTLGVNLHCAEWSGDSKYLVTGDQFGTLTIFDATSYAKTGELKHSDESMLNSVISISFGQDDKTIAVAGRSNIVQIWDIEQQLVVQELIGHQGSVWCVDWSPDGKRVATCGRDGTVKVWDPRSGKLALTLTDIRSTGEIWSVAWDPSGRRLSAGCGGSTVLFWDASLALDGNHSE